MTDRVKIKELADDTAQSLEILQKINKSGKQVTQEFFKDYFKYILNTQLEILKLLEKNI